MRPSNNLQNHARHHVGLIQALVGLIGAATLVLGPARLAVAQVVYPSWSYTGSLNTARFWHTVTLLPSGKVLVAGGYPGYLYLNSAELYDPATGTWSITGNLNTARARHTATLLRNGKVLVAGGCQFFGSCSAELYDPATGTWSYTGNLNVGRAVHTATLLLNGKVLASGGASTNYGNTLNSAELYDPASGTWSYTGNLNTDRGRHTATLLPNGKVLVAGGFTSFPTLSLNSAELYDLATGVWSYTDNLDTERYAHTATLLLNGEVLVTGGLDANNNSSNSAELYNPATGTWSPTGNLNTTRDSHTETLLPSGKVLVAGEHNSRFGSAELYEPATGKWSITAYLNTARVFHTATLLPNGRVLVAGGDDADGEPLNTAELYDPSLSPNSTLMDDPQFFVREHYVDFLNREPDADGLAYWTDRITQCGSDARCVHERRIGVSGAFFVEPEFQDSGYFVYRFYKASFGRQPNYAEFTSDRGHVIGGSNLELNKQAFADGWVHRPAFLEVYPIDDGEGGSNMSNTEFVNKLFDTAGLTASIYDTQRQQEIQAMNTGRSHALVLRDLIEITDFKNIPDPMDPRYSEIKQTSQYNPAFVLMQYFGYLRRDIDQDGYDFWLEIVNNREPNNYRGMICGFITSIEYQLRFGSVATRSNADCSQ
jgi:hypothetical protein